ncbi:MAG: ATP-binding protein [Bacteroidota bacterium]
MEIRNHIASPLRNELALLENALPDAEKFAESRESHIMQRLSHTISTALEQKEILSTLTELTQLVLPVIESGIFYTGSFGTMAISFSTPVSESFQKTAQQHYDEGIIDWVIKEKKTIIVPDFDDELNRNDERNYIIIPLMLRNEIIGVYIIHTRKRQEEIQHRDLQLLSILANTAAVAVENYKYRYDLQKVNNDVKISQEQMILTTKLAAIGELVGGIVHEINNPLQILLGHVQLLQFGEDLNRRTEVIREQVDRIVKIIKQLVEFSRNVPENFIIEPISVNSAVEQILPLLGYQFRTNEIEIELKLDPAIPAINGNMIYLQQVFLNLFLNARDAIERNGKMTVETFSDGEKVYVRITDTGCGIPPENMNHIFEPYFTTKGLGKGTGLGLSVSYGIIKKHCGDITVKSEKGIGSTFTVVLPVRKTR